MKNQTQRLQRILQAVAVFPVGEKFVVNPCRLHARMAECLQQCRTVLGMVTQRRQLFTVCCAAERTQRVNGFNIGTHSFTADAPAQKLGAQHIKTNAAQLLLFALCPKGTQLAGKRQTIFKHGGHTAGF